MENVDQGLSQVKAYYILPRMLDPSQKRGHTYYLPAIFYPSVPYDIKPMHPLYFSLISRAAHGFTGRQMLWSRAALLSRIDGTRTEETSEEAHRLPREAWRRNMLTLFIIMKDPVL